MNMSIKYYPVCKVFFISFLLAAFVTGCEQINTPVEKSDRQDEPAGSLETEVSQQAGQIPGQYIVVFNQEVGNAPDFARQLVGQHNGTLRHTYSHALKGFSATLSSQAASALENNPRVASVEQDLEVHAIDQTLPAGIDRIDADQNSTANIDGSPTGVDADIAILDTGADLDHPDLNIFEFINFTDDPDGDGDGHGTHVSGTAAAIDNGSHVVGAAPGARIWAIKVLDDSGSGTFSDVIAGIDTVTYHAADIEVANMSLGAQGKLDALRTAIQNSVGAGVVYSVSAGNSSADIYGSDGTFNTDDDFIPASYPEVAAISAMADFDGTSGGDAGRQLFIGCGQIYDDAIADCFSNYSSTVVSGNPVSSPGAAIDLAAPGVSVLSTWNDGGTNSISGTSMSSPHVAGIAALYIAEKGLSPTSDSDVYAVRQALIDNGQPQSDWQSGDTRDPDGNLEPLVYAIFDGGSDGGGSTNSAPTASFTYSCTDLTCDFDGSGSSDSDGSISSYDWDFGDGTTVSGQTVSHTYDADGTYTVTLTVTDDDGATDSESQDVSVSSSTSGDAGGIHVGDLDGSSTNNGSTWTADVTVTVHDTDHTAESGSTVSFNYSSRDVNGSTSCTTGTDGTCSVSVSGIPKRTGSVTFDVTDISDSDGSYSSGDNHDPDGDSDGTSITVQKP